MRRRAVEPAGGASAVRAVILTADKLEDTELLDVAAGAGRA